MSLPVVTAENYYSPEMNMAYMGSTQFKAFEKCEAAALAELKGEYHPPSSTALLVGGYIDAWFSGELPLYQAQHPEIFKRDGTLKAEYDQMRYLKNKDTYVFSGKRADQVLQLIAEDYKLKTGQIPNTGYVIPSMVFDIKSLFDVILEALDRTLIHAGRMFYLWDDFGALRLSEVIVPKEVPVIGENSLATGFEYVRSIDGETYNKVKLVRDNETTGKRDVYIAQDSNNMALWGILQYHESVDDSLNAAQIKDRAMKMLELRNRPEQSLTLSALAIPGLRAGQVIFADLPGIDVRRTFLVEEVTQDIVEETMSLKVKVV